MVDSLKPVSEYEIEVFDVPVTVEGVAVTVVHTFKSEAVPQQKVVVVLAALALIVPLRVAEVVKTLLAATVVTVGAAALVVNERIPPL